MKIKFLLLSFLTLFISKVSFSQYAITGEATQTFDLSTFTGTGFTPGSVTSGSLDSDIWGVDFDNDGTMDANFGDTNTGGDYTGSSANQYNAGAFDRKSFYAYTFGVTRIGVQLANTGNGDVALIMRIQNNTGGDITTLDIAYDVQSRISAGGTSGDLEFWHSADNISYTEITSMRRTRTLTTSWGDNEDNVSGTISTTISNGDFYYLKWVFTESTSTNEAAIGIYDIELTADVAAGAGIGTLTSGSTNFGNLSSTSISDPGEDVFDFTIADDAGAGSDAFPIQFTGIVFNEGASDGIDDWSDVIAGARLEDSGGNFINASVIETNSITFSGIPITSSDLGYIADDGSETYTLSVWLNTSVEEEIDNDLLHISLSGADFTVSGATSSVGTTESAESNTSYNSIDVVGTNWGFENPPNTVGVDEDFILVVASVDAYGNIDLDDNSSTFILSRGSTGSNSLTEGGSSKTTLSAKTLSLGRYTYADLQYNASENFNIDVDDSGGSFLASATSADITAAISYQSVGSGDWTTDFATIWEFWNGTGWQTATTFPSSATGTIYVRNGTTIEVNADLTADQIIVENGGAISMGTNNANLTIADGPGEDLIIENGGSLSLTNYNALPVFTGTIQVQGGGTFSCSVGRFNNIATSTQIDWQTDATFLFTGSSAFSYNTDYFPSVATGVYPIIEIDGATTNGNSLWTMNGILKVSSASFNISNAGIEIRDGILADGNVTLGNDIDFSGNTLHFGGTGSINLDGESYSWSGKTIEMLGDQEIYNGSISLDGSSLVNGSTFSLNDGTNNNLNLSIADGAIVNSDAGSGLGTTLAVDGTVTIGNGVDYNFNGSSQQTLNFGTLGITQADRVSIDNSSGVILNSDLTINDRLTLTNGIFQTSSSSEVITIATSGIIVGASSTNYFDGPLEVQGLSSSYTFHSGDGSMYRPVTATPASNSDITVEFFNGTPPDNTSVGTGLAAEMPNIYWEIKRGSGSGDVSVELFYKESTSGTVPDNDEIIDGSYLRLIQYDNGGTAWGDLGLDANSSDLVNLSSITGTITSFFGTDDFYTIGSEASNTLLPVEMISFSGQSTNSSITLNWSTSSELNNDKFEIQHSVDGKEFKVIGAVDGAGTVNEQRDYRFLHSTPYLADNYYRLRQIDFDGQFEFSNIILVSHDGFTNPFSLYANPISDGVLKFSYKSDEQPNISLTDLNGKIVWTDLFLNGSDTYEIDVSTLNTGVYILRVNQESEKVIIR
ncbi:T9SS type A sorting domain-containing protein [Ekhidna sp.]